MDPKEFARIRAAVNSVHVFVVDPSTPREDVLAARRVLERVREDLGIHTAVNQIVRDLAREGCYVSLENTYCRAYQKLVAAGVLS